MKILSGSASPFPSLIILWELNEDNLTRILDIKYSSEISNIFGAYFQRQAMFTGFYAFLAIWRQVFKKCELRFITMLGKVIQNAYYSKMLASGCGLE